MDRVRLQWWMCVCVAVLAAAAAGCNALGPRGEDDYKRILFPLMSDAQKADYYKLPTWPERKAYLYEIKVMQKFESAPPSIKRAILRHRVVEGMTADQVLMSWGPPSVRVRIPGSAGSFPTPPPTTRPAAEEVREQWLYKPVLTPDFRVRYDRAVLFVNGVVLKVREEERRRSS